MSLEFDRLNDLIQLVLNGDDSAFLEIYEISYPILYKQVYSILKNEADAQDVLQEVYIRIWTNLHQIDDAQFFILWAKRITLNTSITAVNRRRDIPTDDVITQLEQNSSHQMDLLSNYIDSEWSNDLLELISQLDPGIGHTIYLRYYEGLKIKTIAEQLGIAEGTVKSRIHSGKKQLQTLIKKDKRFHGLFVGTGVLTVLLQENSNKGVVLAKETLTLSSRNTIDLAKYTSTGIVLTTATGLGIIALSTNTDKNPTLNSPVATPRDTEYPVVELVEYKNKNLSILVSDYDSGIDYDRLYCVLDDGQMIAPISIHVETGLVDFVTNGNALDIHVWDNSGNETCGRLE